MLCTGDITTTDPLDFETVPFHTFTVIACDRGNPALCSNASVRVNVEDFNDESPIFDQDTYMTDVCFSNALSGLTVIQPVATDADSGTNAELVYSLSQSPLFSIDETTGQISLRRRPSVSDVGPHILRVVASNRGNIPLSDSATINIRLLNCSEINFYFLEPFHFYQIQERDNRFTDGRSNQEIGLSRTPENVTFSSPASTNPFTNTLAVSWLAIHTLQLTDLFVHSHTVCRIEDRNRLKSIA